MLVSFFHTLIHYSIEIIPSLLIGFLISGIIHEFVPQTIIEKYFTKKGIQPILNITLVGIILPICCFGSLPLAISFKKKGMPLGPILAFLVATPATSIPAILVMLKLLGLLFTIYICIAVIVMGLTIGIIGNWIHYNPTKTPTEDCPRCHNDHEHSECQISKSKRVLAILHFSFIELPKDIGLALLIGLLVAALVASITPVGELINHYLSNLTAGYLFSLVFGLLTYVCSTGSVPLVDALINQGLEIGAGMIWLLVGPITSYGTLLVLKKQFGTKVLFLYLSVISLLSLAFGYAYSLLT